jgi:hypothetical protein
MVTASALVDDVAKLLAFSTPQVLWCLPPARTE